MDQKFAVLSKGPNYIHGKGYNTVKQARDDGALVLAWGYVHPALLGSKLLGPPIHMNKIISGLSY